MSAPKHHVEETWNREQAAYWRNLHDPAVKERCDTAFQRLLLIRKGMRSVRRRRWRRFLSGTDNPNRIWCYLKKSQTPVDSAHMADLKEDETDAEPKFTTNQQKASHLHATLWPRRGGEARMKRPDAAASVPGRCVWSWRWRASRTVPLAPKLTPVPPNRGKPSEPDRHVKLFGVWLDPGLRFTMHNLNLRRAVDKRLKSLFRVASSTHDSRFEGRIWLFPGQSTINSKMSVSMDVGCDLSILKENMEKRWKAEQDAWWRENPGAAIQDLPIRLQGQWTKMYLTTHIKLTRAQSTMLVQLRSGAIGLGEHLFSVKLATSPGCSCGAPTQDVEHVLLRCP
ncbi:hypothetical protein V8F20_006371 [Naviculisporaceae sp. PSN 640]